MFKNFVYFNIDLTNLKSLCLQNKGQYNAPK